ncbi:M16 family metallopeptidase [Isoptericola rhizosphaerae]|uniref:M16 family metallopeptidase n=1 Tax=Isoptericola rhizosphaerae TaxID=3377837 RepID=UPI00383A93DC
MSTDRTGAPDVAETAAAPSGAPMSEDLGRRLAPLAGVISWSVVDDVPVLHAHRDGPVTGALTFRVGRADETLATAGITHLVEHLALHSDQPVDVHHNGVTGAMYTTFHATGAVDEVVAHLNAVCAALRDLPVARLPLEKQVLRTEASGSVRGVGGELRAWRHGPRGYGLSGFDELGVRRLTEEQVRDWAEERFTAENAVVHLTTAAVPAGLDLRLPRGARIAPPVPTNALEVTPASFAGADGAVVLDAVVDRSPAAVVLTRVASRALFDRLRRRTGLSYATEADYSVRDASAAVITLYADALPERQDAVVGEFVDVLATLRGGGLSEADLDAARSTLHRERDVPHLGAAMLPTVAADLLLGAPVVSVEERRATLDAVSLEDVRAVAQRVWDDALIQTPGGRLDWAGVEPALVWSRDTVDGERYPSLVAPGVALVVGREGASVVTPDGAATVRFADCVALLTRPDGGRVLVGADGFRVAVEPTVHEGLSADVVAASIDRRVADDLTIPLPPRGPDAIPRPPARVAPVVRAWSALTGRMARLGDLAHARLGRWNWLVFAAGWFLGVRSARMLSEVQAGDAALAVPAAVTGVVAGLFLAVSAAVALRARRARTSR